MVLEIGCIENFWAGVIECGHFYDDFLIILLRICSILVIRSSNLTNSYSDFATKGISLLYGITFILSILLILTDYVATGYLNPYFGSIKELVKKRLILESSIFSSLKV